MKSRMMKKIKKILVYFYMFLFHYDIWEERERRRSFGKLNSNKVFYVIRFDKDSFGLITIWKFVLAHIEYAQKKGYFPIIDLKNYYSMMIQNIDNIGKQNAWEYYFEQPSNEYTLEEVYGSKNVILAKKNIQLSEGVQLVKLPMENKEFQYWKDVSSCIPVKREIELMARKIRDKLFPKGKKILGASVRLEYSFLQEEHNKLVNNHPIQPTLEEFIKDIKFYLKEWKCDYCFLAIDDGDMLNIIKEDLGDKCIYMTRCRSSFWKEKRLEIDPRSYYCEEPMRNFVKERGISYLTELLLLSWCDCLLAGKSSGNIFAYLNNNQQYEHIKIYDKGEINV